MEHESLWLAYAADPSVENRNKLAEVYVSVAEATAASLNQKTFQYMQELESLTSYAYEALLLSIPKFDLSMNTDPKGFLVQRIRWHVIEEVRKETKHRRKPELYAKSVAMTDLGIEDGRPIVPETIVDPCLGLEYAEVVEFIRRHAKRRDRQIVKLRYCEGLTNPEIAELLGVSEATSSQVGLKTIREIRKLLSEESVEEKKESSSVA